MLTRLLTWILVIALGSNPSTLSSPEIIPTHLTLSQVFSSDHSWTATLSASQKVTLLSTGDIMLGRTLNSQAIITNDFHYPFNATEDLLSAPDLTFVNLETPITTTCKIRTEGTVFCASANWLPALKSSGIDVVSLANNHTLDATQNGLAETVRLISELGLSPSGVSGPVTKVVKGQKFTFLSYNDISRISPESAVKSEIPQASANSDLLIVSFHFGNEYTHTPSSRQKMLSHLAIDLGADLVIGHHPHWVQPLEIYKSKPIIYSHGNFIFDQYWSKKTQQGLVSKLTFYNKHLVDLELNPIAIDLTGQPHIANTEEAAQIIGYIKPLSTE